MKNLFVFTLFALGASSAHADPITDQLKNGQHALRCDTESCDNAIEIAYNDVIVFGCLNFPNVRYLMNQSQTAVCHISNPQDAATVESSVPGGPFFGWKTIFYDACPDAIMSVSDCSMTNLRNF